MRFWLNIDHSTKIAKLHKETCIYYKPYDQHSKPINDTNSNGGWFVFESAQKALQFYKDQKIDHYWQPCRICKPE